MEHISYQDWKLFYKKTGQSNQAMLLFHGFGQSHKSMMPLVEELSDSYTCYNFDLFFHGESTGPEDETLEIDDWNELIQRFLDKENIDEFNLSGFSLGGKYVLAIMMAYPTRINQIYFLAPDGIKTNIWYNMATYPHFLRKYFKSMIRHPQRFYVLVRAFTKIGLVSKGLSRFVETQMNTPDQRTRVYKTWVGVRHVKFRNKKIIKVINDNYISVAIILGKYDKIIPVKPFQRFCNRAPSCKLEILEAGHNDLIKAASSHISKKISAS